VSPEERGKLVELIRRGSRPLEPRLPGEDERRLLNGLRGVAGEDPGPRRFRALLFDIYGTLFLSGSGDMGVLENGLCGEGSGGEILAPFAAPEDLPRLRGMFIAAVRDRHDELRDVGERPEVRVEEIWAELLGLSGEEAREFALRFELAVNPVYPMPGLERILLRLRKAGVPLGIVSNAQFFTPLLFPAFLGKDLGDLGFDPELTVFSFREGEAKPSPRLFEKAARALGKARTLGKARVSEERTSAGRGPDEDSLKQGGLEPGDVLFVGNDMLNDVWAARTAGFAAALYAGDGRSLRLRGEDPRCRDLRPDLVVESLDDVVAVMDIEER